MFYTFLQSGDFPAVVGLGGGKEGRGELATLARATPATVKNRTTSGGKAGNTI